MDEKQAQASGLDVFVSYSRRDLDFVDRLQPALAARGVRAAVDRTDIEKGEAWWTRIEQLIREADAIVFVLSPDSAASETCQREVDFAESLNKRFTPVVVRDLGTASAPPALARLNYIFLTGPAERDPQAFDAAVDDLVRVLRVDLGWVREHTRLGSLAARWEVQRRSPELVLRGSELKRAEAWATTQPSHGPVPTKLHYAFIAASRQAAIRRQRILSGVSLGGLIVACALAGVALWQWRAASENARLAQASEQLAKANEQAAKASEERAIVQRNIVYARQLGTQAQALLSEGIGAMQSLGVLLAVEGTKLYPNAEATTALQRVVRMRAPIKLEVPSCEFCVVGYYSAFSPDSKRLAVAGTPARVIDVSTGETALTLGPTGDDAVPAMAVAYDPTGQYIATVAGGRNVTLWSAETGALVGEVPSPGQMDGPITFNGAGDRLAVAADRADVELLSVPALETIKRFSGETKNQYGTSSSLSFDADGKTLAQTAEGANQVALWNVRDGKTRTIKLNSRPDFAVFTVHVFNAIGDTLAVGTAGTVRLLDPKSGAERARLGETEAREMTSVAFGEDDRIVGVVGWDAPAKVWDIESRQEIHRFEHERQASSGGRIASMSISPDGRTFATHGDDILRIWHSNDPQLPIEAVRKPPSDPGLSKFEGLTSSSTESEDRAVCLEWKGATAQAVTCTNRSQVFFNVSAAQPIRFGAISQTGRYGAIVDDSGRVVVLDASGREIGHVEAIGTAFMAIDERKGVLALLSPERGIQYVSLTAAAVPPPLADSSDRPTWARFSDSGEYLLTSQDGTLIALHEVASGRTLAKVVHDRPVTAVLWLEEPRYLATASVHDGTARVWDTQANALVVQWHLLTNMAEADLGVSSDGRYLWFAGSEHRNDTGAKARTLSRYELWRPADLVEAGCLTVNRELSNEEWLRYLPQPMERHATCPSRAPTERAAGPQ
jgi:WD40 repeat protein